MTLVSQVKQNKKDNKKQHHYIRKLVISQDSHTKYSLFFFNTCIIIFEINGLVQNYLTPSHLWRSYNSFALSHQHSNSGAYPLIAGCSNELIDGKHKPQITLKSNSIYFFCGICIGQPRSKAAFKEYTINLYDMLHMMSTTI